jgi:REP element-mobilizing transposase RayT
LTRSDVSAAKDENMDSGTFGNKNVSEKAHAETDWRYNWQHVTFVTAQRKRNFKKEYNRTVTRHAIEEAAVRFGIGIREFGFGPDYAHVHMELSVPDNLSMNQTKQILKSHSASVIFREIPGFHKLYPRGHFWGGQCGNHSVGPVGENIVQNYIRRQDISRENDVRQTRLFN